MTSTKALGLPTRSTAPEHGGRSDPCQRPAAAGYPDLLDASGNHLWSRRFTGAGWVHGVHLAVGSTGEVVLGGSFSGSVDFGSGALSSAGGHDAFAVRLDAAGNPVWSKQFGDAVYNAYGAHLDSVAMDAGCPA